MKKKKRGLFSEPQKGKELRDHEMQKPWSNTQSPAAQELAPILGREKSWWIFRLKRNIIRFVCEGHFTAVGTG